jgi:hypothetical protein
MVQAGLDFEREPKPGAVVDVDGKKAAPPDLPEPMNLALR